MSNSVSLTTHKRIRKMMEKKKRRELEAAHDVQDRQEAAESGENAAFDMRELSLEQLRQLADDTGIDLFGLSDEEQIRMFIADTLKTQYDAANKSDEDEPDEPDGAENIGEPIENNPGEHSVESPKFLANEKPPAQSPDLQKATLAELQQYARDNNIDLSGIKGRETIRSFLLSKLQNPHEESRSGESEAAEDGSDA